MQETETFSLARSELVQICSWGMLKDTVCGINNTEDDMQVSVQDEGKCLQFTSRTATCHKHRIRHKSHTSARRLKALPKPIFRKVMKR
jgi:hypothetical protein